VTGLGPTGNNNAALGGWYFNGTKLPIGECSDYLVQPLGADINNSIGVINLFQCRPFAITGEGIYTCTIMNSSMMNQSIKLGIYFPRRS